MDGLGPHFLLASSLKRWYLVLQRSRMSSKCFLKVSWESKVIPRNFTWYTFRVLPYSFRLGSVFLASMDLENIIILVFSGFSLILHLAHHTTKFRRSCCKNFAAKRTFKLKIHCAVSSANWEREFCLWCRVGRSLTWIRKSNGLRTEPCGTPALGFIWLDKKPCTLTCITRPTKTSESQWVILVGRSNWNILYVSPLCQTLSNAFSTSRKAATTCSPLLKPSMMDWDSLNRWSSVDFAVSETWLMLI